MEGKERLLTDPEWLAEQHWGHKKSLRAIAKELGVTLPRVQRAFGRFELPVRDRVRAVKMATERRERERAKRLRYRDKEWLEEMYIRRGLSAAKIARECRVNEETIRAWLKRYGLTKPIKKPAWHDRDWLYNEYVVKGKTAKQIAEEIGRARSSVTVRLWLLGIRKTAPHRSGAGTDHKPNATPAGPRT